MNHVATWFEIPVTNMERAKNFYQHVMETSFKDDVMNDGWLLKIGDSELLQYRNNGRFVALLMLVRSNAKNMQALRKA